MAAAAILDFEKSAIVGAWHHPDFISRGSEDSKTVLTSNHVFSKGVNLGFLLPTKRLLQKLETYGIRGQQQQLKWIEAFLCNRHIRVIVDGEASSESV